MSKGAKLFAKIVYYLFTFLIGVLLALALPMSFITSASLDKLAIMLDEGRYEDGITLVAAYFNKQVIYSEVFDGGGFVLFETVMQDANLSTVGSDENASSDDAPTTIHKSYAGFLFGVKNSYSITSEENNQTVLVVTTASGNKVNVPILTYDSNNDGKGDGNYTARAKGLILIDLNANDVDSVAKLEFLDKDGQLFKEFDLSNMGLDFSSPFFADVDDLVEEYNRLITLYNSAEAGSNEIQSINSELTQKFNNTPGQYGTLLSPFLAKSDNYAFGEITREVTRVAGVQATVIVVVYFVCIYVLADFMFGNHYILKFFRWLIYKVFKVKQKTKQPNKSEVFGYDYYSQVTVSLDLDDVPDFNESVQIKYTNSDVEIVFILLKENNYKVTQRIKAGVYVNPFIDINRQFAPINLPDNLEVEGYRMDVNIKIIKREV